METCTHFRVEETLRKAVGFLWLYPPFPASCPFKSTMAYRESPPHGPRRADFPQRVLQALLPVPTTGCAIRGSNSGC
jgi:hypothetical protein